MRPRLLDLFCGAGGAAVGYHRAGFDVIGVDIVPQWDYPFTSHQADALEFVAEHGHEFDAIHASPPCQTHSRLRYYQPEAIDEKYADLIEPTRALLQATGLPYVIENVPTAPLIDPVTLCGCMFPGLMVYRPRKFEANFPITAPPKRPHDELCVRNGYLPTPDRPRMSIHGGKHSRAWQRAACGAMDVIWMAVPQDAGYEEVKRGIRVVCESIPPAYTEHVSAWLHRHLTARAAA